MAKKTPKPAMVDLTQFESLEQALARITVIKPFNDLARQILQSYIDRDGEWALPFAFFASSVSRGRALHEAIVREITPTNSHWSMRTCVR